MVEVVILQRDNLASHKLEKVSSFIDRLFLGNFLQR
jgi:hypothetical protein